MQVDYTKNCHIELEKYLFSNIAISETWFECLEEVKVEENNL